MWRKCWERCCSMAPGHPCLFLPGVPDVLSFPSPNTESLSYSCGQPRRSRGIQHCHHWLPTSRVWGLACCHSEHSGHCPGSASEMHMYMCVTSTWLWSHTLRSPGSLRFSDVGINAGIPDVHATCCVVSDKVFWLHLRDVIFSFSIHKTKMAWNLRLFTVLTDMISFNFKNLYWICLSLNHSLMTFSHNKVLFI
jgi:hypothetical protein